MTKREALKQLRKLDEYTKSENNWVIGESWKAQIKQIIQTYIGENSAFIQDIDNLNFNIVSPYKPSVEEFKAHHDNMKNNSHIAIFNIIQYIENNKEPMKKESNSTNIINVGGDIIGSQVGHESDFRDSEFHQIEKTYPNNPAATSQEESTIFQKIWAFFNHQVIGGLFVGIVIALITWWLSK